MKRPIHLYIFVALSTIATVLRIHGAFYPAEFDSLNDTKVL